MGVMGVFATRGELILRGEESMFWVRDILRVPRQIQTRFRVQDSGLKVKGAKSNPCAQDCMVVGTQSLDLDAETSWLVAPQLAHFKI